jgi:CDP-diacylglycerol--glycerol-3-phosphate 3-phosphatidyltransferase
MVIIALMVIVGYSSMSPWLVLPATVILFREVFVSGLREYLGDTAGTLKVTKLAKWKTTAQMIAIAVLFAQGIFEHYIGLDMATLDLIRSGAAPDEQGVRWLITGMDLAGWVGLLLLWLAAALTLVTGYDYLMKAIPYLREEQP